MKLRSISTALMATMTSLSLLTVAPVAPASVPIHAPRVPGHEGRPVGKGSATSTNWSGYAVPASNGQVSDVTGNWTVPATICSSGNQYSSIWVGIDGYNSNSVEQTGTEQDCVGSSSSYYAWYEMYPQASVKISGMTIHAGDQMFAEVHYNSGTSFTLTLTDQSTGGTFSTNQSSSSAVRSSAEWIVEAPSSIFRVLPLADFGTASLSNSVATINGVSGTAGSYSANTSITMETTSGTIKAQPSSLTNNGANFTDTWHHR